MQKHLGGRQPGVLSPARRAPTPDAPGSALPATAPAGSLGPCTDHSDEVADAPMERCGAAVDSGACEAGSGGSELNGDAPAAACSQAPALAAATPPPSAKRMRTGKSQARGKGKGKGAPSTGAAAADATPSAGEVALPTNYNIAGYLPLRQDFDIEHDNEAELILADMEFNDVRVAFRGVAGL